MTGIYNQNLNYRCRDYRNCKSSLKFITVNPFTSWEELKPHSKQCRANNADEYIDYDRKECELQLKFNNFVEQLIHQEKFTKSKAEQLYTDIKFKAFEVSKGTNFQISTPDKNEFGYKLKRERDKSKIVSFVDKIIFSSTLRKTQGEKDFLRFWTNVLDKNSQRQQVVFWMSGFQKDILLKSKSLKIGLIDYYIPKEYEGAILLMALWEKRNQYLPWGFGLVTSTKCIDLYNTIFRYLIVKLKVSPKLVTIPWKKYLFLTLKQLLPKTKFIGCFRDLNLKLLKKCLASYPESLNSLEELNYRFFTNISKSFLKQFDVEKAVELIHDKIESSPEEKLYSDLKQYLKKILFKYAELFQYKNCDSVTLSHIDEFWQREVVCSGENSDESLVWFIKSIIRIENELHYNDMIKSDLNDFWIEVEKEDTFDITELNMEFLKQLALNSHPKNLLDFDYDSEMMEIAKIKEQQNLEVLEQGQNNPIKSALKKEI